MRIEFNAEKHEYRADGIIVPSVTQLCPRNPGFDFVPQELLAAKSATGTAEHRAIDRFVKNEAPDFSELAHDTQEHFERFIKRFDRGMPAKSEHRMYSEKYKFAGTVDLIWERPPCIMDKKPKADAKRNALQLAGYALLLEECEGIRTSDWFVIEPGPGGEWRAVRVFNKYARDIFISLAQQYWRNRKLEETLKAYFRS